ncbi:TAF6-like RNA polymerase II p300/CBP-associated factor-associated factor 65 kDa subunit 6L [Amphiura filiformis]|uniref:TAF6-like RNA polymerase II p300/CBP-associated factor-associated factor 65 kDa subunit 6L n=1 Tax=Amphiura filiformis TaxID=82378 RepID=UPI003B21C38B
MAEEKKFAAISTGSVKLMSEASGVDNLSDEITTVLAEDVGYRLREATQASAQFMKHAKRKRMSTEDFNKALRWSDTEPLYGYGSSDPLPFKPVKECELFFPEDKDVSLPDLATDNKVFNSAGKTTVKATWLAVEGILKPTGAGVTHNAEKLPDHMHQYYTQITKAVLEGNEQLRKAALQDLHINNKIAGLLPYLVNFVSCGVKMVSHDLVQLTRLLDIVNALTSNPVMYLGPYLVQIVSTVMYCILEPLAVSINPHNDHWALRDFAARLLGQIMRSSLESSTRFYHQLIATFQEVLNDPARPLCSHYGAVVGLKALGPKAIEQVLVGQISSYWPTLQQVLDDTSLSNVQVKEDGHKVHGAILSAAVCLLKCKQASAGDSNQTSRESSPSQSPGHQTEFAFGTASHLMRLGSTSIEDTQHTTSDKHDIAEVYAELYEYLGDSLTARLGFLPGILPKPQPQRDINLLKLVNGDSILSKYALSSRVGPGGDAARTATLITRLKYPDRPRLPNSGREGLRPRHAKVTRRGRSRSTILKDAFPLAKTTTRLQRTEFTTAMTVPGKIRQVRTRERTESGSSPSPATDIVYSAVWRVNAKMPLFGKRRQFTKPTTSSSNNFQKSVLGLNSLW